MASTLRWAGSESLLEGCARHLKECRSPAAFLRKLRKAAGRVVGRRPPVVPSYHDWLERQHLTEAERERIRSKLDSSEDTPIVSLFLPLIDVGEAALRRTFKSLARQSYMRWELLLAVVGGQEQMVHRPPSAHPALAHRSRLFGVSLWASEALNRLLDEARAEFIALIDAGDELEPDAVLLLADAIRERPAADCFYSDEDVLNPEGGRDEPRFKPDWSPERFEADGYVGRLAAFRRSACREIGGFRAVNNADHEFDLLLRLAANGGRRVEHLPRVLYHRHGVPPWLHADSAQRARAELRKGPPTTPPKVSIVIPTAGRPALIRGVHTSFLLHCVESIRRSSSYPDYEIVAVDNGDLRPKLIRALEKHSVRRVTYSRPFNLAGKMNLGASLATGEYLAFLNDDTEVISPDWLERLLDYAIRPGVGAVGAKLFFPDGRLQHVGVHVLEGNPGHPFYALPGSHRGYFQSAIAPRNYLAVTGACLMTRKDLFDGLGGFDERFPLNYNDVDYCLRLFERGLRSVFTPFAQLYHFEAVSKEGGPSVRPGELELFHRLWKQRLPRDPFYNDNLSPHGDYRLKE